MRISDWSSDVCSSDQDVVTFHVLQFAALGTMQFAGTVAQPVPGDPHSIYLLFDLSLRQVILLAFEQLTGVKQSSLPPLATRTGENAALIAKLADTVAGINGVALIDEEQKRQAQDRSEEQTSELQSLMRNSYTLFCLKQKQKKQIDTEYHEQNRQYQ